MRRSKDESEGVAVLAVLAAAREAEELLTQELDLEPGSIEEANRRLRLFMRLRRATG